MAMTDPIADMLTRIRNANKEMHETLKFPSSNKKINILETLKSEGFIEKFEIIENDGIKKEIKVTLKYKGNQRVITGIKRISKPSLRVYVESTEVPRVYNGLGTAILNTNQGVITDRDARKQRIGGEVIAYIW